MAGIRPSVAAITVVVALGVAGCGGSSKSSSSSSSKGQGETTTTVKASKNSPAAVTCTSLSDSFAQQILGGPTDPPMAATAPSSGCSWYRADKIGEGIVALNVQPITFDGGVRAKSTPAAQAAFSYEDVSGLGDVAYFQTPKGVDPGSLGGVPILLVRKGNTGYNISVRLKGDTPEQLKALEKQVAEELLKG